MKWFKPNKASIPYTPEYTDPSYQYQILDKYRLYPGVTDPSTPFPSFEPGFSGGYSPTDRNAPDSTICNSIRLAFDCDGVLTLDPLKFSRLIKVLPDSALIFVVTGRPPHMVEETIKYLEDNKIRFTKLYTYPIEYDYSNNSEDNAQTDIELEHAIGKWKSKMARNLGIDMFFEDHPIHAKYLLKNSGLLVLFPSQAENGWIYDTVEELVH